MSNCRIVKGGVCSAKGFRAAGVGAAIKYEGRNDVALIVADAPCAAAAVFTTNRVAAAPVLYDREIVKGGRVQAILANSGCANACTGEAGLKDAKLSALVNSALTPSTFSSPRRVSSGGDCPWNGCWTACGRRRAGSGGRLSMGSRRKRP